MYRVKACQDMREVAWLLCIDNSAAVSACLTVRRPQMGQEDGGLVARVSAHAVCLATGGFKGRHVPMLAQPASASNTG
jgi:hypothetical protein